MSRPLTLATFMLLVAIATARADRWKADTSAEVESVVPVVLQTGPEQSFVDFDRLADQSEHGTAEPFMDVWTWQLLPNGLIYESYLAGTKESRMSFNYLHEDDVGWVMDGTVGGRVGLFRYGTANQIHPDGMQLDVEGSAQLRLDADAHRDLRSVDFRCGVPLSWGTGPVRWKFSYYHLSSHLGDEFLLQNPGVSRLNFSRDVLVLGRAFYLTPRTRIYGEAGWAFYSDVSDPWEFQFGIDHAPDAPTGTFGAPFWAVTRNKTPQPVGEAADWRCLVEP